MPYGRFEANSRRDGKLVYLGHFGTAEAAALAVARDARERGVEWKEELTAAEAIRQAEAEGLELVRSATSASGYTGVNLLNGRFQAQISRGGQLVYLGYFDTAEAAALAIARYASPEGGTA